MRRKARAPCVSARYTQACTRRVHLLRTRMGEKAGPECSRLLEARCRDAAPSTRGSLGWRVPGGRGNGCFLGVVGSTGHPFQFLERQTLGLYPSSVTRQIINSLPYEPTVAVMKYEPLGLGIGRRGRLQPGLASRRTRFVAFSAHENEHRPCGQCSFSLRSIQA